MRRLRAAHDPAATEGVPAHVTLLFPFRPAAQIDAAVRARVAAIAAAAEAFDFTLARTGRFDDTLYLAPEPAAPFVALTQALATAFPEHPPYGGLHRDVTPHVTVARGDALVLGRAAAELEAMWPSSGIAGCADEILLIANDTGRWRTLDRFPLSRRATTIGGGDRAGPSHHSGGET